MSSTKAKEGELTKLAELESRLSQLEHQLGSKEDLPGKYFNITFFFFFSTFLFPFFSSIGNNIVGSLNTLRDSMVALESLRFEQLETRYL